MKYLLLTHVPTYAGQSAGVVRMTEAFRDDLLAQSAALHDAGFAVTLATPRHAAPDVATLAREHIVDVRPRDLGIAAAPLPPYLNMPQFMAAGVALKDAILEHGRDAAIVQMGAGGHPMALGEFAWPMFDPRKVKRVFVFSVDPIPARQKHITSGRNPAKRLAKRLAVRRFETFCWQAVREADLVFAHAPAVSRRFSHAWADHCHAFTVAPLKDGDFAEDMAMNARSRRVEDRAGPLKLIARGDESPTAGMDHLLRAVAKVNRLGGKLELHLYAAAAPSAAASKLLATADGRAFWQTASLDRAAFDGADIFVAASLIPGENALLHRAAARGLPMVGYGSDPAEADLARAGGGVSVDRGDADRLAQALLDVARDRGRLPAMQAAAWQWAQGLTRRAVHRRRAQLVRECVG